MTAPLAIISLALLLIVFVSQFGNELYYRKRVSALGVMTMVATVYLMWYLHTLNNDILELVQQLAQYQTVKLPKGE